MRLAGRSALVIAGLSALACTLSACRAGTASPSGREALASAVADTLPFQSRLSGGFAPSKRGPTRGAGDRAPELSPDARIAIALLEKRAIENPTPQAQADLGVGYLIQGDVDRAITTIEDAASQMTSAAPWSDLSAAYLAKAERTPERRLEYLARALEAAEASLKVSTSNAALFNRALARDGLAPFTGNPAPWSEYAAAETDQAWRAVAAQHAAGDHPSDDVRERWESRKKQLVAQLKAGDMAFVKETVRLFPEASIDLLDREALLDVSSIADASLLASAIHETTGDPMARDEVRSWRSHRASLARGHQAYAKGLAQIDADDYAGARRLFDEALSAFSQAEAPYAWWAQARLAAIDWREGSFGAAQRNLSRVETEARARGYTTLLARVLLQRGLIYTKQWQLTEGLAAIRASAALFEASAQQENAVGAYSNLADVLRTLGESHQSWEFIGRTLERLSSVRRPIRRYLLLYNAALFARREQLIEAALLFQDGAVREAAHAPAGALTEALIQRAVINVRRGDNVDARGDVDRAAQRIASAPDEAVRAYMSAELGVVRAQLPAADDAAIAALHGAIDFFSKREPGRVPGLYLMLARASQNRPSGATAEDALRTGIEKLESQQAGLGDEALRISFFDESWSLFRDMVALQVAAGNSARAFEYSERSRARSLLATAQGTTKSRTGLLPDIQAQLPPSVVLIHYTTLADRLLIWTITASNAVLTERTIDERDLGRLIAQQRAAIHDHRDEPAANDRLYKLLIDQVLPSLTPASLVVLIPDGQLQQLPFAALRDPATRRYLIEDHTLLVSPSASFFVDARAAAMSRASGAISSALLIGNPAADGPRSLPGAEEEVAGASLLYPRHEVLVGRMATKDRFIAMAPSFDVVHFGGHAIANPEFPLLSRLIFAGDADSEQSLFAHEIARLRFARTRVVLLAACSTAAGAVSRGEGVVSVARPFLGGGVPLVIASQWDVDDRATQQLTLAFHRELSKSGDPIRSLQAAQLALLRSGDAAQALPESWGAFVAVGTAAAEAAR